MVVDHMESISRGSDRNLQPISGGSKAWIAAAAIRTPPPGPGSFGLYDPDRTLVGQYSWEEEEQQVGLDALEPALCDRGVAGQPGFRAIGDVTIRSERTHRG